MMQNETSTLHKKTVDRFDQEKLYMQLTRIFLEEISSGRWQLEQQIPTEEELCRKYDISKVTVRQAVNNLVAEGYLTKIQGKGTFVTCTMPAAGLAMKTRLTENMFGEEVKVKKEILSMGVRDVPADAGDYLQTGEAVVYVLCRRLVNGEPAYIEESFIPQGILPDLNEADITEGSLYSLLQDRGGKKIFKIIQTVEVGKASGDYAGNLNVKEGSAVLLVHRLLLSFDSSPVAYTRFLGGSGRYKFQSEFERIR